MVYKYTTNNFKFVHPKTEIHQNFFVLHFNYNGEIGQT